MYSAQPATAAEPRRPITKFTVVGVIQILVTLVCIIGAIIVWTNPNYPTGGGTIVFSILVWGNYLATAVLAIVVGMKGGAAKGNRTALLVNSVISSIVAGINTVMVAIAVMFLSAAHSVLHEVHKHNKDKNTKDAKNWVGALNAALTVQLLAHLMLFILSIVVSVFCCTFKDTRVDGENTTVVVAMQPAQPMDVANPPQVVQYANPPTQVVQYQGMAQPA